MDVVFVCSRFFRYAGSSKEENQEEKDITKKRYHLSITELITSSCRCFSRDSVARHATGLLVHYIWLADIYFSKQMRRKREKK